MIWQALHVHASNVGPPTESHGPGLLAADGDTARYFVEGRVVAELRRCRLEGAAADGIRLSGFAVTGTVRGVEVLAWREWWVVYPRGPEP